MADFAKRCNNFVVAPNVTYISQHYFNHTITSKRTKNSRSHHTTPSPHITMLLVGFVCFTYISTASSTSTYNFDDNQPNPKFDKAWERSSSKDTLPPSVKRHASVQNSYCVQALWANNPVRSWNQINRSTSIKISTKSPHFYYTNSNTAISKKYPKKHCLVCLLLFFVPLLCVAAALLVVQQCCSCYEMHIITSACSARNVMSVTSWKPPWKSLMADQIHKNGFTNHVQNVQDSTLKLQFLKSVHNSSNKTENSHFYFLLTFAPNPVVFVQHWGNSFGFSLLLLLWVKQISLRKDETKFAVEFRILFCFRIVC